ncbi:GNAT family N-acetyltransferase [Sphingomonas ginsenosidivorax]|uniref:GNAT family N-acetyltransferase n=1 Tax=Sphingomonas ginsenosidivorax TaxID=862135 RepID=A0A5C6UIK2_9SPHN|nr:GNAT family N-acetyltransferase [Sphingomonas ginsenosidivorax]TXC72642.1 GNAT family N-acetyltransferase [Sphingomonas ginsenosidivorax]
MATPARDPFPVAAPPPPDWTLRATGIALRPASDADMPFLERLYAASRADELAHVPWTAAAKAAFVASQFALQHRHYTAGGSTTDFWIVERHGHPAGRLYVDRAPAMWHLVDLLLASVARGRGIGSALLDWLQQSARASGASGIDLHVLIPNMRAAALYARHGFTRVPDHSQTHRRMIWRIS